MDFKLKYYLQIADNALILSHRLGEVVSRGPYLEEDIANTNVALDLIGMAESIYEQAALLEDKGRTGDDLVYRRAEHQYFNANLVEQPNKDFAYILVRQFLMDAFHVYFLTELTKSKDEFLAAVAIKSLKEVTYHLRRSSEWMIRLGDGTAEASERTKIAIRNLWKFKFELFTESEADLIMKERGEGVDLKVVEKMWRQKVREIFFIAQLEIPEGEFIVGQGKSGNHTEYLGKILAEMQFLPTHYPDAVW
ncbi:MAG: phenylacetate-CoA oxygenase subunit PaaC [Crocinitomicaceae bacterium]|nr:phenylacetate-CoA oxygenase subunit PaaC [Crocinitomicaceae bacterium]